jgi:hypothetical protein
VSAAIIGQKLRSQILDFVSNGGTVITETETDSFSELGFYNYPQERPLLNGFGLKEIGKRPSVNYKWEIGIDDQSFKINLPEWINPIKSLDFYADRNDSESLFVRKEYDKGKVIVLPNSLGYIYNNDRYDDFEEMMSLLCKMSDVNSFADFDKDGIFMRTGAAGSSRLLFIGSGEKQKDLQVKLKHKNFSKVVDLLKGKELDIEDDEFAKFKLDLSDYSYSVLECCY